jgi:hypothetical protein
LIGWGEAAGSMTRSAHRDAQGILAELDGMLTPDEMQFVIERFRDYVAGLTAVRATAVAGLPTRLQTKVADGATPEL